MKYKKAISKKHIRLSDSLLHFLLFVDVYVLRNHSAKENVSVVSKENLFLSVNWKDSLLITLWSMASNRLELTRRTDTKLPLSVQALQDLPVQATLQSLAMM